MVNGSQKNVSAKSNEEKRLSASSTKDLIRRLMKGRDARVRFVDSHLSKGIAFQVQALRDKEDWSQQQLAGQLGSNQNAVYRLENPNYGKQTLTTLKKVAAVFDVALVVRFVPFSQLLDWVTGTPRLDPGLGLNTLAVPNFDDEARSGIFNEPSFVVVATHNDVKARIQTLENLVGGRAQGDLPRVQKLGSIPISYGVEQPGGGGAYAEIGCSPG